MVPEEVEIENLLHGREAERPGCVAALDQLSSGVLAEAGQFGMQQVLGAAGGVYEAQDAPLDLGRDLGGVNRFRFHGSCLLVRRAPRRVECDPPEAHTAAPYLRHHVDDAIHSGLANRIAAVDATDVSEVAHLRERLRRRPGGRDREVI